MTKDIINKFKNKIAIITANRRKSNEALKENNRWLNENHNSADYWDRKKDELLASDFYCSESTARHTMLAYGTLRGRAYKDIENTCREEPSAYTIALFAEIDKSSVELWLRGE